MSSFYHPPSGKTFYVGGGIPGRSAYEEAVALGLFSGTAAEFIEWLRAPRMPLRFLPPVADVASLPAEAEPGDAAVVIETGRLHVWQDGAWGDGMPWVGGAGESIVGPPGPPLRLLAPVADAEGLPETAEPGDAVLVIATGELHVWQDGAWSAFPWIPDGADHLHPEATPEAAGFMSAADKAKLDGLSASGSGGAGASVGDVAAAIRAAAGVPEVGAYLLTLSGGNFGFLAAAPRQIGTCYDRIAAPASGMDMSAAAEAWSAAAYQVEPDEGVVAWLHPTNAAEEGGATHANRGGQLIATLTHANSDGAGNFAIKLPRPDADSPLHRGLAEGYAVRPRTDFGMTLMSGRPWRSCHVDLAAPIVADYPVHWEDEGGPSELRPGEMLRVDASLIGGPSPRVRARRSKLPGSPVPITVSDFASSSSTSPSAVEIAAGQHYFAVAFNVSSNVAPTLPEGKGYGAYSADDPEVVVAGLVDSQGSYTTPANRSVTVACCKPGAGSFSPGTFTGSQRIMRVLMDGALGLGFIRGNVGSGAANITPYPIELPDGGLAIWVAAFGHNAQPAVIPPGYTVYGAQTGAVSFIMFGTSDPDLAAAPVPIITPGWMTNNVAAGFCPLQR